jgi:hypothetical protein
MVPLAGDETHAPLELLRTRQWSRRTQIDLHRSWRDTAPDQSQAYRLRVALGLRLSRDNNTSTHDDEHAGSKDESDDPPLDHGLLHCFIGAARGVIAVNSHGRAPGYLRSSTPGGT